MSTHGSRDNASTDRPDGAVVRAYRTDDADAPAVIRRYDLGAGGLMRSYRRDSDGALLLEGILVREGILEYKRADGTIRRELVTLEAVKSMARTIARAPVTLLHPASGFVTTDSAKDLIVGDVDGEVVVEEDAQGAFARIKIAVRRRDAIEAIKAGVRELSPGYAVVLDETPGENRYGRYDARQIERDGNHAAIVPSGRGGETVSLRTDSADAVQVAIKQPDAAPDPITSPTRKDDTMKPKLAALLSLLGVSAGRFDNEDAALDEGLGKAEAIKADADKYDADAVKARADEKAKTDEGFGQMKKDLEKALGENETLKADLKKLKDAAKKKTDDADLKLMQELADKVDVKHDGLDLPALRIAIAKTRIDSVDAKTSSDRIDGILSVITADAGEPKKDRWTFDSKPAGDGDPNKLPDQFANPYLDHADEARAPGGAK